MSELPVFTPGDGPVPPHDLDSVTIDCDHCVVRSPRACEDCVVSVLLGGPPQGEEVSAEERGALDVLASSGLVPPLRLVTALPEQQGDPA